MDLARCLLAQTSKSSGTRTTNKEILFFRPRYRKRDCMQDSKKGFGTRLQECISNTYLQKGILIRIPKTLEKSALLYILQNPCRRRRILNAAWMTPACAHARALSCALSCRIISQDCIGCQITATAHKVGALVVLWLLENG